MSRSLHYAALVAFAAVTFASPLTVKAGPGGGSQSDSPVNFDLYYDYEVWCAQAVIRYFVVAEFSDGHTEENEFFTQQSAEAFVAWLYFHVADIKNAYVEARTKYVQVLIGTYDTRAEAENVADDCRGRTEIVPVRAFGTTIRSGSRH